MDTPSILPGKTAEKKSGGGGKKTKSSRNSTTNQLVFKVLVRGLPSKDFKVEQFKDALHGALAKLNVSPDSVEILRFLEGKLSRKRGPVPGACFLLFKDPASFHQFMSKMNLGSIMLLEGEAPECQPTLEIPIYQKVVEKDRFDKLDNTLESSADYQAFLHTLEKPVPKLISAEARLEQAENNKNAPELDDKDPKKTALLVYLKELDKKQKDQRLQRKRAEQDSKDRPRGGKTSSQASSRPSTASSKSSSAAQSRKGSKPAAAESQKPKDVPKMTILKRKPAASADTIKSSEPSHPSGPQTDIISNSSSAASTEAPSTDKNVRPKSNSKQSGGSNRNNRNSSSAGKPPESSPSVAAPASTTEGAPTQQMGKHRLLGEERKKQRAERRAAAANPSSAEAAGGGV